MRPSKDFIFQGQLDFQRNQFFVSVSFNLVFDAIDNFKNL
jgi:hypothetical protein